MFNKNKKFSQKQARTLVLKRYAENILRLIEDGHTPVPIASGEVALQKGEETVIVRFKELDDRIYTSFELGKADNDNSLSFKRFDEYDGGFYYLMEEKES